MHLWIVEEASRPILGTGKVVCASAWHVDQHTPVEAAQDKVAEGRASVECTCGDRALIRLFDSGCERTEARLAPQWLVRGSDLLDLAILARYMHNVSVLTKVPGVSPRYIAAASTPE